MSRIAVIKRQLELPRLYDTLSDRQALNSVISRSGLGIYASSDRLFKGAVFGRDSLEVAEDLIAIKPKLVTEVILTMASLRGETFNEDREEEFGKIIHEYRTTVVDGKPLDPVSRGIFERLARRWGGDASHLAYYGSVDSTPLYLRLVGRYCGIYGPSILAHRVTSLSGQKVLLRETVSTAYEWLMSKLRSSRSGLLEYKRLNPHGIENQVWKDSAEFYMHADGSLANHDQPIASVEVQALAYDALLSASKLLKSKEATKAAERLREMVFAKLWMPSISYFSLGLDYGDRATSRSLNIITANPAEMLDSQFFDDLATEDRHYYLSSVIRRIMGEDFLTDAGIRSRALCEAKLVPHWDYHGSFTTWPKETYDIAKGLRRQGFTKLAIELENRILNTIRAASSYPEFFYVDRFGRVLGMAPHSSSHGEVIFVDSSNRPEKVQAWTVSAVIAIKQSRKLRQSSTQDGWQKKLEKEVLQAIPHVPLFKSKRELRARYPFYPYELKEEVK